METNTQVENETASQHEQAETNEDSTPKDKSKWTRALLMLLFLVVFALVEAILWLVTVVGFIAVVINDRAPAELVAFGEKMANYSKSIISFLSYNTEQRPWPLDG